jgi:hypothetical protein
MAPACRRGPLGFTAPPHQGRRQGLRDGGGLLGALGDVLPGRREADALQHEPARLTCGRGGPRGVVLTYEAVRYWCRKWSVRESCPRMWTRNLANQSNRRICRVCPRRGAQAARRYYGVRQTARTSSRARHIRWIIHT